MIVSPLDYRYGREEVKAIFSEESNLGFLLEVEAAIATAEAEAGIVSRKDAEEIRKHANLEHVKVEEVKKVEREIGHNVMAVVKVLSRVSGESGKYVHLGATSNDVTDTANALQLKKFYSYLVDDLFSLSDVLYEISKRNKDTVMMGRTHGQHALPITFGLKTSVYLAEMMRHIERVEESRKRVVVGKFMGAVGTGAALGKDSIVVQSIIMKNLAIGEENGPTQIVDRDRYVEYVSLIANIATSLEKFATEIRNLQRPEIGEVQEPFDEAKQVGSSTMAQKVNPVVSENIVSLARIIRGFLVPMHESAILWHERDLTNSASERFIIPYISILIDDILNKMTGVFKGLKVNSEMMKRTVINDDLALGEAYLMALVNMGYGRQEAHEIVRQASMEVRDKGGMLIESIERRTGKKMKKLSPLDYTGNAVSITESILKDYEKMVVRRADHH
ncbi:MAG: adenylosuccinate lyase [Candidatus Thermoplasmatota archaeon]|jgi:adenylosuccinate lyase|nr:adenylosuccinate lyase [Candidatus Thermoplasmatota archaeon]MCL5789342.1 adenylosuccinate lyase [Candidatus Thermoplasmatota archaeon]